MKKKRGVLNLFSELKASIINLLLLAYIILLQILISFFMSRYPTFDLGFFVIDAQTINIVLQLFAFIVPTIIYFLVTKNKFSDVIKIKPISFVNVIYIILITALFSPINMIISAAGQLIFPNIIGDGLKPILEQGLIFSLLVVAVMPAICEEIMFRGVLLSEFKHSSKFKALFFTALYFAFMHLNFQQSLYAFTFGLMLGFFVLTTDSILSSMISHFVVNGTSIVLMYVFGNAENFKNIFGKYLNEKQLDEYISQIELSASAQAQTNDLISLLGGLAVVLVITLPFLIYTVKSFVAYNKKIKNVTIYDKPVLKQTPPSFYFVNIIILILYFAFATIIHVLTVAK